MIGGVLGMGRQMAESRMTDQCSVTRPGGKVLDEATGEYGDTTVTVYEGKCRIKNGSTGSLDAEAAGKLVAVEALAVHLPLDAVGVSPQDLVTVTGSETRPDQVGRKFTVKGSFDGSQTTALRYRVEVADGRT